ncbi:MAG: PQQ-dependent sugar dehydrogenase, partial [Planctomycetales bacterium]|nr:PQQ-dependent sugar dehydrogenase [Planctomycetales bacterium]
MKIHCSSLVFSVPGMLTCILLLASLQAVAAEPSKAEMPKRAPWTTSRITGSPEKPLPYVTERAFPELKFKDCLDITSASGSDRLFIVEQSGKIFSFKNQPDVKSADLVIDIAKHNPKAGQTYALAFHTKFQQNRYCYVCYILNGELPDGSHIARFKVSETDPPTIDPASETTIITWLAGGHNGCSLKFGLDSCLYISTGDGSGPNPPDSRKAGQDVSNLLS